MHTPLLRADGAIDYIISMPLTFSGASTAATLACLSHALIWRRRHVSYAAFYVAPISDAMVYAVVFHAATMLAMYRLDISSIALPLMRFAFIITFGFTPHSHVSPICRFHFRFLLVFASSAFAALPRLHAALRQFRYADCFAFRLILMPSPFSVFARRSFAATFH